MLEIRSGRGILIYSAWEGLTHCRLNRLPHTIYWKSPNFNFSYVRLCDFDIHREKMANLFANRSDQTPHSVAFDLGLHWLPISFLRVSRLQLVKQYNKISKYKMLFTCAAGIFWFFIYYFQRKKGLAFHVNRLPDSLERSSLISLLQFS